MRTNGVVHLVGSVPLPTVEEVFRVCSRQLGDYVRSYPDGEVGDRRYWTFYLPTRTYSHHPDLDAVNEPSSGRVQQPGRNASREEWDQSWWTFKIRPGVKSLSFGGLGYTEEALRSYSIFRRLRGAGEIPAQALFQVNLPTTGSAVMGFFADPADWPAAYEAYQGAVRREAAKIAEAIPHEDLVIQWDTASEVRDILAGDRPLLSWSPQTSLEEKWDRHLGDMSALAGVVPDDVGLGYHFCFGTWGGWPKAHADDMGVCVRLANEAARRAKRPLSHIHMPVMPDADEAFFAPLRDLAVEDTRIYLGLVLDDGLHEFERRVRAAQRYLSDFGIGSYCGWGREDPADLQRILENMRASAERFVQVLAPAAPDTHATTA